MCLLRGGTFTRYRLSGNGWWRHAILGGLWGTWGRACMSLGVVFRAHWATTLLYFASWPPCISHHTVTLSHSSSRYRLPSTTAAVHPSKKSNWYNTSNDNRTSQQFSLSLSPSPPPFYSVSYFYSDLIPARGAPSFRDLYGLSDRLWLPPKRASRSTHSLPLCPVKAHVAHRNRPPWMPTGCSAQPLKATGGRPSGCVVLFQGVNENEIQ